MKFTYKKVKNKISDGCIRTKEKSINKMKRQKKESK